LCRTSGVPTVIARLFAFVGPYQDVGGSFAVPDFIRRAIYDKSIRIHSDGSALRTYCYASDLTISLWKLLLNGKPDEL
jgi:dTDP-glucose 4,6-dehydratase